MAKRITYENKIDSAHAVEPAPDSTIAPWKVHTANLLAEIGCNPGAFALRVPLMIFSNLLNQVGTRCSQLNDPVLNGLMCQLTIYAIADPESEDYDVERVNDLIRGKDEGVEGKASGTTSSAIALIRDLPRRARTYPYKSVILSAEVHLLSALADDYERIRAALDARIEGTRRGGKANTPAQLLQRRAAAESAKASRLKANPSKATLAKRRSRARKAGEREG